MQKLTSDPKLFNGTVYIHRNKTYKGNADSLLLRENLLQVGPSDPSCPSAPVRPASNTGNKCLAVPGERWTIHTKLNSHQGVDGEQDSQLFGISWLFLALQCIRNENTSQYKKATAAILGGNVAGFKSNWAAMSNLGGAALAERSRRVFVFVF